MTWCRHAGDAKFHAGTPRDGSFCTLCKGRWPLTDIAYGEVESSENPADEERCGACVVLLSAADAALAREVERLRKELETRARELAEAQEILGTVAIAGAGSGEGASKYGSALVEAIGIAQAAGRRGLLSIREHLRLRELAKVVPQ